MYIMVESSEPITLKKYKDFWQNMTGFTYERDFNLFLSDEKIIDDNYLMTSNLDKENY